MSEPVRNPDELTGAELAAAVAERVMGWTRVRHSERWFNDDDTAPWIADFRPDLNIAQAWEVVDRMKSLGWNFNYDDEPTHNEPPCAGFYKESRDGSGHYAQHKSGPTAICLAALKAVESRRV